MCSMNCKVCRLCGVEKSAGHDLFGPDAIRTGLLSKILSQFSKEVERNKSGARKQEHEKLVFNKRIIGTVPLYNSKVISKLYAHMVIQIDASDNLTKFVCHDCELTVNHFAEFCEMVKKTQETFAIKYSSRLFVDLEVEKTIEQHANRGKSATVSVGPSNKIRCEICLQNLELTGWMTHWHIVTNRLGTVYCSCQECGHLDDVNSFIKENSVSCPSCFFTTCRKTLATRRNKNVHVCEICSKSFRSLGHKNRHKMIHDGLKPFLCETCGTGFNQKVSLKAHLLTHTSNYPHRCEWCGQAFRHKVSLQSHVINVHTAVAKALNYECDQCKKVFATNHKLTRHYRSHTGVQPYRCRVCSKMFSQTGNLKTHLKKHKTLTEFTDIDTTSHLLDSPTEKMLGAMFNQDTSVHHNTGDKEYISLRSEIQDHNINFNKNDTSLRKDSLQDVFSDFDPHACDIYNTMP